MQESMPTRSKTRGEEKFEGVEDGYGGLERGSLEMAEGESVGMQSPMHGQGRQHVSMRRDKVKMMTRNLKLHDRGGALVRASGASTALWDDWFHDLLRFSIVTLILVMFLVYLAANVVFALLYMLGAKMSGEGKSFHEAFYLSVQTMSTIGYGRLHPDTPFENVVCCVESFFGMALTALGTGILFTHISRPRHWIVFADRAVVRVVSGVPTLCIRWASQRPECLLLDVNVQLSAMVLDQENDMLRLVPLALVRETSPVFYGSWVLMHRLDDASPVKAILCAPDAEDHEEEHGEEVSTNDPATTNAWPSEGLAGSLDRGLVAPSARLQAFSVSVTAIEDVYRQPVYAMSTFAVPEDIHFNHTYVDMVDICPRTGAVTIKIDLLSLTEPIPCDDALAIPSLLRQPSLVMKRSSFSDPQPPSRPAHASCPKEAGRPQLRGSSPRGKKNSGSGCSSVSDRALDDASPTALAAASPCGRSGGGRSSPFLFTESAASSDDENNGHHAASTTAPSSATSSPPRRRRT